MSLTFRSLSVAILKLYSLWEITNFELASCTLKEMASFEENLDRAGRPACFFWGMIVRSYLEYVYGIYNLTGTFGTDWRRLLWTK